MLATWLNEQAVTAYQLIKSESKEFTSEVVYKLAAVSLIVCLRFWRWCVHWSPVQPHFIPHQENSHIIEANQNKMFYFSNSGNGFCKIPISPWGSMKYFWFWFWLTLKKKCTKCKCNPPTVSQIYRPSGYKTHVNARWKESDPVSTVCQRHKDSQSVNNEEMQRWMKGWMKKY